MVCLAGIQVNVEVDGKALTEYDDDDAGHATGPQQVSKYIETIAGKPVLNPFPTKKLQIQIRQPPTLQDFS